MVPPGLVTRTISRIAVSGSGVRGETQLPYSDVEDLVSVRKPGKGSLLKLKMVAQPQGLCPRLGPLHGSGIRVDTGSLDAELLDQEPELGAGAARDVDHLLGTLPVETREQRHLAVHRFAARRQHVPRAQTKQVENGRAGSHTPGRGFRGRHSGNIR